MPQYKYSRDDYYRLTNAPCLDVAKALGMEINERESDRKSWKIKGEQGLCIYREGNGWYRFSDGRHGFPIDLVKDKLCCSTEQALDFIARYVVNGVSEQVNIPRRTAPPEPEKPSEFSPPAHDISPKRVMAYLIKTRGIDPEIVKAMIQQKMIAEDSVHHNCLFFGRDENGVIRSCALRGSTDVNAHYVKYIGEREHVLKFSHESNLVKYMGEREHAARQSDNGLFGYINGKFSDSYSTSEMQNYVRKISTSHRNVFHSIFSFTPESAEEAGLRTLIDWEEWVKFHISDISRNMNMKLENIEYLAAVHLKAGQPHVHIMWWDKAQEILINRVNPAVCDQIRIDVIKSTYHDQFVELHNKENSLIKELRRQVGHNAAGALSETKHDDFTEAIFQKLTAIREMLPPKGQAVYKLMPKPVKQELNTLTHFMIDNIPEFRSLYDEILDCRRVYNEMLHSDDSSYGKLQMAAYMGKVVDEIEAGVGNTILSAILRAIKEKTKNPPERNSASTNRHSEWQRQCTVQLISSVGKLLGQFSDSSRDRLHDASNQVFGRGDLSKEQIRELLLKKQDKENNAEM